MGRVKLPVLAPLAFELPSAVGFAFVLQQIPTAVRALPPSEVTLAEQLTELADTELTFMSLTAGKVVLSFLSDFFFLHSEKIMQLKSRINVTTDLAFIFRNFRLIILISKIGINWQICFSFY
jgi:hypothetical protein